MGITIVGSTLVECGIDEMGCKLGNIGLLDNIVVDEPAQFIHKTIKHVRSLCTDKHVRKYVCTLDMYVTKSVCCTNALINLHVLSTSKNSVN